MKYEDTVMKTAIGAVWDFEKFKLDQAEITWGRAIKEVVDWIYEKHFTFHTKDAWRVTVDKAEWQAKLKDWGIDGY